MRRVSFAGDCHHIRQLSRHFLFCSDTYNEIWLKIQSNLAFLPSQEAQRPMDVTPDMLGKFPLLKSLSPATLERLASASVAERFSRRAVVLDSKLSERTVCFLFEGRLQGVDFTVDGKEVGLYFIEQGDYCGEVALFDEQDNPELIIALAPSLVIKVPNSELQQVMLENASVMNSLGYKLAARIRQFTSQRALLAISNIPQRVCCQLWSLLPDSESSTARREICNPPTHLEIANMLNTSRETVTRVFQTLQNRQIVKRNGPSSLLILNPKLLQRLAEGDESL